MKNFVFAILLLVAVIAGVGAYRGWFTMNKAKIEQDEQTATAELHDLGQQAKAKSGELSDKVKGQK